jgi:TPP-dependent trihydroxycyclohexane-1,2-dione (THcHDO) dehydratase
LGARKVRAPSHEGKNTVKYIKIIVMVEDEKVDATIEHLEAAVGDEWYATTLTTDEADMALIDEGQALRDE